MLRRHRFSRGMRRAREPMFWDRSTNIAVAASQSAIVSATLFDPGSVTTGNQDLRYSIRAVRFAFDATFPVAIAVASVLVRAFAGIYIARAGESPHSPIFLGGPDEKTDWIWRSSNAGIFPTTVTFVSNSPSNNLIDGNDLNRVKVGRKMNQNDQLVLVVQAIQPNAIGGGGTITFGTPILDHSSSVLWQRTMRR